ncbi:uncharacterized protein LOC108327142 [Vigna angularis]|uniref:uncharacterized protein LOC108327142 n=1 Tax=Phaseolus angularis TaxID=3914 RepID=UPI0022B5CE11|nr:uncharacterized protein LOC108327142 [Vigna angularis]
MAKYTPKSRMGHELGRNQMSHFNVTPDNCVNRDIFSLISLLSHISSFSLSPSLSEHTQSAICSRTAHNTQHTTQALSVCSSSPHSRRQLCTQAAQFALPLSILADHFAHRQPSRHAQTGASCLKFTHSVLPAATRVVPKGSEIWRQRRYGGGESATPMTLAFSGGSRKGSGLVAAKTQRKCGGGSMEARCLRGNGARARWPFCFVSFPPV